MVVERSVPLSIRSLMMEAATEGRREEPLSSTVLWWEGSLRLRKEKKRKEKKRKEKKRKEKKRKEKKRKEKKRKERKSKRI